MSIPGGQQRITGAGANWLPAPGRYLCGLTWNGACLWHSDQEAGKIYAIDRASGRVLRTHRCDDVRADLAFDGSLLCQVGGRPKQLVLVDPVTGEIADRKKILPANGRVTGAEFGPEGLWLVLREPTVVQLRDYPAMTVQREYPVPGSGPSGLTYADGIIVFGEFNTATLHAIDAKTGAHLASAEVQGHPTGLTWDGDRLWYCDFGERMLRALDLADVLI